MASQHPSIHPSIRSVDPSIHLARLVACGVARPLQGRRTTGRLAGWGLLPEGGSDCGGRLGYRGTLRGGGLELASSSNYSILSFVLLYLLLLLLLRALTQTENLLSGNLVNTGRPRAEELCFPRRTSRGAACRRESRNLTTAARKRNSFQRALAKKETLFSA